MPGGDGVTLAKAVRRLDPFGVKVFLVTGFADISPMEAYNYGVDGFLAKPFNLETIRFDVLRSLQPMNERWKNQIVAAHQTIALKNSDWQNEFKSGGIRLGRGGLFLPEESIQTLDTPLTNHEVVELKTHDQQSLFKGVVRWLSVDAFSQLRYGIEFLHLEPEFLNFYLSLKEVFEKPAFIPLGPSSV
jgi:YesN/AraC family two-component response regulator